MAAKYITLTASKHPGLQCFWTHSNKYLFFSGTQVTTLHKRCLGSLLYKPLCGGQTLLTSQKLEKLHAGQFSSGPMRHLAKKLGLSTANLDSLEHQMRSIGNVPATTSNVSVLKFLSLKSLFSTPYPFMIYGVSGLIPFLSVPAYMYLSGSYCSCLAHCQLAYGACILSFLGGVSWGHEMGSANKVTLSSLSYSIALPLIAWPAVLLYPNSISFLIMICGVSYAGFRDVLNPKYPKWFINLRFLLSTLVASALTTTLIFSWTMHSKTVKKVKHEEDSSGAQE